MLRRLMHLIQVLRLAYDAKRTPQTSLHKLAKKLGQGRGLPMKIGQIIAGMHDEHDLSPLTQSVSPLPNQTIIPILEKAWGKPITTILKQLDESKAAASLGQVHHAICHSGEAIAIKVQYPDIHHAIQSELKLIGYLPKAGPIKQWNFDWQAYKSSLNNNLNQELDYMQEMHHQMQYAQNMRVEGLHVPQVFAKLCRPQVLVQQWVSGERLSNIAKHANQFQRLSFAKILMQTLFQSLFQHGLVHGDPHPGNLLLETRPKPTVHLLDYGCMIRIDEKPRYALLQLILSSRGNMHIDPLQGFVAIGFDAVKLQPIAAKLPALMQIIFRPFLQDTPFDLHTWHPAKEVESLLGKQKWLFRAAGPANLFLLMRVFQGLTQQLQLLQSQLPWFPLLKQCLPTSFIEHIKQQHIAKPIQLPKTKGSATKLLVYVYHHDKLHIHFELPAASALNLHELIPASATPMITQHRVDIPAIEQRLQQQGLEPGTLLDIQDQEKRYVLTLR